VKRALLFLVLAAGAGCAQEPTQLEAKVHEAESAEAGDKFIGWKWANFAILAAGLGYLISRSAPAFFRSRSGSIQKGIAEAQQVKHDAEQQAAATAARLAALGADIEKFRTEARAEMQREGDRIQQETARHLDKVREQAAAEIEAAGKVARRELKSYAAELALNLAERRIRGFLDPATEAVLVEGFVNDLKKQDPKGQESPN
jgi:F-type H+-transporting ATPase subunit b